MEINGKTVLYKVRVGSFLYGTSTPESDEDYLGVFVPSPKDYLGLNKVEQISDSTKDSTEDRRNTIEDIDCTYYSLPKFLRLLLNNNPNIIEMLFVNNENIVHLEYPFDQILSNPEWFVSSRVQHSFAGYAYSQRKKLIIKKERFQGLQKTIQILEGFHNYQILDPKHKLDIVLVDILNQHLKYYKGLKNNTESFHVGLPTKIIYEKLVAEYERYGWRVHTDSFAKVGYDTKFGYNLIRLLWEGKELIKTGKLTFPLSDEIQNVVSNIRNCYVTYTELLELYDVYKNQVDKAVESCTLPRTPKWKIVNNWLVEANIGFMREYLKEYYDE